MGTQTGKFVFVSGLNGGREVFFGRPIDEPYGDTLTIEGKSISATPQGVLIIRPFTTLCTFPTKNPGCQIQQITNPEALNEVTNLFNLSVSTINRSSYPLTYRWIESALFGSAPGFGFENGFANGFNAPGRMPARNAYNAFNNPFTSFYQGFTNSAEQFRRALFQSPQVTSTRELDKLTELEGDLVIEIGKITNQTAIQFNQVLARNNELARWFESIQGYGIALQPATTVGGWCYLINRLQIAKNWARKNGKTPLVREINALIKNGIHGLDEMLLEHCATLDTLITETFGQYGITFEIHGELSPFASWTAPFSGSVENYETNNAPVFAGAGA